MVAVKAGLCDRSFARSEESRAKGKGRKEEKDHGRHDDRRNGFNLQSPSLGVNDDTSVEKECPQGRGTAICGIIGESW